MAKVEAGDILPLVRAAVDGLLNLGAGPQMLAIAGAVRLIAQTATSKSKGDDKIALAAELDRLERHIGPHHHQVMDALDRLTRFKQPEA